MIKILLIFLLLSTTVYAGSSVTKNWAMPSPPTIDDTEGLYKFFYFLYTHFNQTQIVTTNPSGTTKGQAGNFLLYNNAGTWKICFETDQPSGTTWKCANLS